MFSKYYQNEITFLRHIGQEFAHANPAVAGLLSERGTDPDVERLLEGFAFLAARVRERIEEQLPEVVQGLTEILLPHYLRPLPACSVVEFLPASGSLRARVSLPAGSEVKSVPVEGTQCRFRTTAPLDFLPLTIREVVLDQAIGANPVLRIRCQVPPPAFPAVFHASGVRLFIHGELPLASTLLLWFTEHLRRVEVHGLGPKGMTVTLDPASVRAPGFSEELPLLPWPRLAPRGYRVLQELFTLPQKFLFIDIVDLHLALGAAEENFEIVLGLERPPELPSRLGRDILRPNCVPVVNLFSTTADPLSFRELGDEHLLRVSGLEPGHAEVYSIDSAIAVPETGGARFSVAPFHGFGHGAGGEAETYYEVRRAIAPVDEGLDTWVSLSRPIDAGPGSGPITLSLDVTATNRELPSQLKLGDISVSTTSTPTSMRFRNITMVSPPGRPPLGTELHWRLLAHLSANRTSVANAEVVRALVELYNFQVLSNQQLGRANQLRAEGVREVRSSIARRIMAGAPIRGTRLDVELDEGSFAGPGDAWLFARALDELFASQVTVNSFSQLAVELLPSRRAFTFRPRSGGKAVL